MKYLPVSSEEKSAILKSLNMNQVDDLFRSVPAHLKKNCSAELEPPKSEIEIRNYFQQNTSGNPIRISFMGGNGHTHYIPSVIDPIVSRGEFLTAYTPYQPEVSQGTLQSLFEYQSMMASLMGVEVSNASVYDGSTAMLEACYMALRITRKEEILISDLVHPEYMETLETYSLSHLLSYYKVASKNGHIDLEDLEDKLDEKRSAALVIASPNYYGLIEDIKKIKSYLEGKNILLIVVVTEALSLGLLTSPGELGADIVCGEAQSFGIPLSFGGPWLGFLGCGEKNVRNLPGRIIGEAKDADNKRAFVITLAAREQHIRREKATSNICTNQGLMALRASIYLSIMGRVGLRRAAERSHKFAALARKEIQKITSAEELHEGEPIFNEFVIRTKKPAALIFDRMVERYGIAPGNIIGTNELLSAFNETMSPDHVLTWASGIEKVSN